MKNSLVERIVIIASRQSTDHLDYRHKNIELTLSVYVDGQQINAKDLLKPRGHVSNDFDYLIALMVEKLKFYMVQNGFIDEQG